MGIYEIPAEPATGMAEDGRGITWRRRADGLYEPDCCKSCGERCPAGPLSWPQLLAERGPLNDPA